MLGTWVRMGRSVFCREPAPPAWPADHSGAPLRGDRGRRRPCCAVCPCGAVPRAASGVQWRARVASSSGRRGFTGFGFKCSFLLLSRVIPFLEETPQERARRAAACEACTGVHAPPGRRLRGARAAPGFHLARRTTRLPWPPHAHGSRADTRLSCAVRLGETMGYPSAVATLVPCGGDSGCRLQETRRPPPRVLGAGVRGGVAAAHAAGTPVGLPAGGVPRQVTPVSGGLGKPLAHSPDG